MRRAGTKTRRSSDPLMDEVDGFQCKRWIH